MGNPILGQINIVGFNFAPRGWALCNNQLLAIAQNTALFSLLGTTFGGDGRTTFALPRLRGRTARHVGTGAGLSPVQWGQVGGSTTRTLLTSNLPSHTHTVRLGSEAKGNGATNLAANAYLGNATDAMYRGVAGNTNLASNALNNTGSGQSFDILNPFLGLYHCIATQGLYPSRS